MCVCVAERPVCARVQECVLSSGCGWEMGQVLGQRLSSRQVEAAGTGGGGKAS